MLTRPTTHPASWSGSLPHPMTRSSMCLYCWSLLMKYWLQAKFHSAAPPWAMAVQYTTSCSSKATSLPTRGTILHWQPWSKRIKRNAKYWAEKCWVNETREKILNNWCQSTVLYARVLNSRNHMAFYVKGKSMNEFWEMYYADVLQYAKANVDQEWFLRNKNVMRSKQN